MHSQQQSAQSRPEQTSQALHPLDDLRALRKPPFFDASATFVDMSKDSLSAVKYNLEHTKLGDNAKVVQTDALSFLKLTKDKFDIVFLDPPYASSLVVDSMKLLSDVVAAGGCAICETPVDSELPESFGELKFHRSYRYGKIKITVYRKEGEDE